MTHDYISPEGQEAGEAGDGNRHWEDLDEQYGKPPPTETPQFATSNVVGVPKHAGKHAKSLADLEGLEPLRGCFGFLLGWMTFGSIRKVNPL